MSKANTQALEAELAELRRKIDLIASTPAAKRALAADEFKRKIAAQIEEVRAFLAAEPADAEAVLAKMPAGKRKVFITGQNRQNPENGSIGIDWRELARRGSTMSARGQKMILDAIEDTVTRGNVERWMRPIPDVIKATLMLVRGERTGSEIRTASIQTDDVAYPGFELDGYGAHFEMAADWRERLEIDAELAAHVASGRVRVEAAEEGEARSFAATAERDREYAAAPNARDDGNDGGINASAALAARRAAEPSTARAPHEELADYRAEQARRARDERVSEQAEAFAIALKGLKQ